MLKIFIIPTEEAHKASQANVKRQFAMFSSDFRRHANAMVEEMSAYMRVSPCQEGSLEADVMFRNRLEMDVLDTRDAECASTQAVVNAAQEWNAQRVSIQSSVRTTQLCQFHEG